MEQDIQDIPATASTEQIAEQSRASLPLRKRIEIAATSAAAIALCAVVGAVASKSLHGSKNHRDAFGAKGSALQRKPYTMLDSNHTTKEALHEADEDVQYAGRAVSVTAPSQDMKRAYRSFFQDNPVDTPPLKEVIRIRDKKLFRPETSAYPQYYPFEIYNATEYPINLRFINYALKATRYWLNDVTKSGGSIDINGDIIAKVRPKAVPHSMLMVDEFPDFIQEHVPYSRFTHALTYTSQHDTRSFIVSIANNEISGPPSPNQQRRAFRLHGIGAEVCHSLVDFYDPITVPGGLASQQAVQRVEGTFFPPAAKHLTPAVSDSECNALGDAVTAAYLGGAVEVARVSARIQEFGLLQKRPWQDQNTYDSEVPGFVHLAKGSHDGSNETITTRGDSLPTINYYRHYQNGS